MKLETYNFDIIISNLNETKIEEFFILIERILKNLFLIWKNISNTSEEISKEIYDEENITLDVSKSLNRNLNIKNFTSILDADFISSLQNLSSTFKEKKLNLVFPGRIIISKKVIREVTYTPSGILHPLSSRKLISYFSEQLGATIIDPVIEEDKKEVIINLWKKFTNQGKKASQSDEQKFINSGDMSILYLCCKLNPQPIAIFSNNKSEIEKIGQILRNRNMAYIIRVVNFEEVYSKIL